MKVSVVKELLIAADPAVTIAKVRFTLALTLN